MSCNDSKRTKQEIEDELKDINCQLSSMNYTLKNLRDAKDDVEYDIKNCESKLNDLEYDKADLEQELKNIKDQSKIIKIGQFVAVNLNYGQDVILALGCRKSTRTEGWPYPGCDNKRIDDWDGKNHGVDGTTGCPSIILQRSEIHTMIHTLQGFLDGYYD